MAVIDSKPLGDPLSPTPDVYGNNPSQWATDGGQGGGAGGGFGLPGFLKIAGLLGQFFSKKKEAEAQAKIAQSQLEAQQKGAYNQNQLQQAQLDLQRRLYQDQAMPRQAQNTALGDLLANVQDMKVTPPRWVASHMPTVTGGVRPSALGPNARAAGKSLSDQSLAKLQGGNGFDPVGFREGALPDLGAGASGNIGTILALASQLADLYKNRG